ncbi:hypothetical protein ACFL6T_07005, partial [Candidatus Zixiibacteriota bacterium]
RWPERIALLDILRDGDVSRSRALIHQNLDAVALWLESSLAPLRRLILRYYATEFDSYPFDRSHGSYHLTRAHISIGLGLEESAAAHFDSFKSSFTIDLDDMKERGFRTWWTYAHGFTAASAGQVETAVRYGLESVLLLSPEIDEVEGVDSVHALAEIYVLCKQYDDAVETLEWLLSIPSYCSVASLRTDPMWSPLHDHEGFRRLVGWK